MQYKHCGLRNGTKKFCLMMPRPCPTEGQERIKSRGKALADTWWTKSMADKVWRRGQSKRKVDTGGHKADTRRTHGRHMADTWRTKGKADTWQTRFGGAAKRTQHGHKADTRQTHGGHMADKVWRRGYSELKVDTRQTRGGHMTDTRRTSSGEAARAYRGQPFFLKENPTLYQHRPQTVFMLVQAKLYEGN